MIDDFHKSPHEFLSNFHPSEVTDEMGVTYSTVEHAYQASKSLYLEERKAISLAPKPARAKRMGQKVALRPDWDKIKLAVMYYFLKQKFSKREMMDRLLATGEEELVEGNWWGDTFWGVCRGVGENHLGKILMLIRDGETESRRLERSEKT